MLTPRNCTNLAILSIILLRRGRGGKTTKLWVTLAHHVAPAIHYSENLQLLANVQINGFLIYLLVTWTLSVFPH